MKTTPWTLSRSISEASTVSSLNLRTSSLSSLRSCCIAFEVHRGHTKRAIRRKRCSHAQIRTLLYIGESHIWCGGKVSSNLGVRGKKGTRYVHNVMYSTHVTEPQFPGSQNAQALPDYVDTILCIAYGGPQNVHLKAPIPRCS